MRTEVRQARKSMLLTKPGLVVVAMLLTLVATWISIATIEAGTGDLEVINDGPTIGAANVGYQSEVVFVFQPSSTIGAANVGYQIDVIVEFFGKFTPAAGLGGTFGAANVDRPFDPEMRLFRDIPPLFQRLPTIGPVNA